MDECYSRERRERWESHYRYRTGLVCFLDILGFATRINEGVSPYDILKILGSINEAMDDMDYRVQPPHTHHYERIEEDDDSATPKDRPFVLTVSDSVIRVIAIEGQALSMSCLLEEANFLSHAMIKFISEGFAVRGGMTVGSYYLDNDLNGTPHNLFGPAYQRAYILESQIAKYPRIVVDKAVIDSLRQSSGQEYDANDMCEEMQAVFSLGEDGELFIDYLKVHEDNYHDAEDVPRFLRIHKEFIESGLTRFASQPHTAEKYVWLRRYHNEYVHEMHGQVEDGEGIIVGKDSYFVRKHSPHNWWPDEE